MTQRDRILLTVVALAAVLGGFWFGVLKPKRAEVQALDQQLVQQQTRLTEAQTAIAAGEQARESFGEDYATVAKLGKAVPVDEQMPSLVYQLQSAANSSGVDFRVLKRRAVTAAPAPVAAAPAADGAAPTQAVAAVAPPGTQIGPAGFPTMPFTFKFEGDFFRMERMLSQIERFTETFGPTGQIKANGRLVTVDGFSIGASKLRGFPYVSASVTATAYLLPPGEDVLAGATPQGPTTAAAPAAPGTTTAGQTGAPAPSGTGAPKSTTAAVTGVTP